MKKWNLVFSVVCIAALVCGVVFGFDFATETIASADPKPGG